MKIPTKWRLSKSMLTILDGTPFKSFPLFYAYPLNLLLHLCAILFLCRCSSVVEQRFCKPLARSSNLLIGSLFCNRFAKLTCASDHSIKCVRSCCTIVVPC